MDKKTLSVPEAGKALGVGRSSSYEAARTGQIPTIRIGKRILVPIAALERMLAQASPELLTEGDAGNAIDGASGPERRRVGPMNTARS